MLEHAAFFDALGATTESGDRWRSILAGLLVLRLISNWLETKLHPTDDDGNVAAVRDALSNMPDRDPAGPILRDIVDRVTQRSHPTLREITLGLSQYGQELRRRGEWTLALDVFETHFQHAQVIGDIHIISEAGTDVAVLARRLGRIDRAATVYSLVEGYARRGSDNTTLLRMQVGAINSLIYQGKTAAAHRRLELLAPAIEANGNDGLVTSLYEIRMEIDLYCNHPSRGLRWGLRALEHAPNTVRQESVRSTAATGLMIAGCYDDAQRALTELRHASSDAHIFQTTTANLIEVAVARHDRRAFDEHRAEIGPDLAMPTHRSFYHYAVAIGYHKFGQHRKGVDEMATALDIARTYRLGRAVRLTQRELKRWGVQ